MPNISTTQLKKKLNRKAEIAWSESYMSLLLGIAVVLVVGLLSFSVLKGRRERAHLLQETSSTSTSVMSEKEEFKKKMNLPGKYTVSAGDDLTKISQKYYKTADKWTDIARFNSITDPDNLPVGTVLVLPSSDVSPTTSGQSPQSAQGAISGNRYTTQDGDYLWNIAERAYGDGNRALDIIKENSLTDPDHLISGMVLKIPRP